MPVPLGFTAIKEARQVHAKVNLLGVVVDLKPPKATRGTDYSLEFTIQDEFNSATADASSIVCRVFRPRHRLPPIASVGDVVLLRNFKLVEWSLRVGCVSDSKSFAGVIVFRSHTIPVPQLSSAYQVGSQHLQCEASRGTNNPTIGEQMAVINLKAAAAGSVAPGRPQSTIAPTAPIAHTARAPPKLSLIKDLELSKFYDVRAQVVNAYYDSSIVDLKVTDYTENEQLFYYADPSSEDASMVHFTSWKGPYGKFTLGVTLYENNAAWARENVTIGDYVFLRNMRTKLSRANKLEGALHQDRQRVNQVDIRRLSNPSDIAEIDARRQAYEQKRSSKSALAVLKDTRVEPATVGRKAAKKKKKKEQKEAEMKEIAEMEERNTAERNGLNQNGKETVEVGQRKLMRLVRAAFPEMKLSTISEILYNPALNASTAKYNDFVLPFVNARHRSRVRVVDVYPPELVLFSHSTSDRTWYHKPSRNDPRTGQPKVRWEWGFVLLVEDALLPPNTVSEKLRVVVGNSEAQGLLGLKQNASE